MSLKVYISHSIRGKYGVKATDAQMAKNNKKAICFYQRLKRLYKTIEFYCPGEHDAFVLIAYRRGFLSEKQILDVDCEIVSTCNLVLNYSPDGYTSRGMQVENDYASLHGISIITLKSTSERELRKLDRFLESVLKG